MITHEQNESLTRVEGDAPMGKLMREHYWIPACLSSQLIADGKPLHVRLLGKDYVAFRATDGRLGFLDERCPHRGVSLALGRNENCALTCIFHGWKIDVSGKVVDVPTQYPRPDVFAAKVKVNHYPAHEAGGIVWVWLSSQAAPKFPELPFTILPESRRWITITKAYCNWLQGVEATVDSAHIGTLHQAYLTQLKNEGDRANSYSLNELAPRYEIDHMPYGLAAAALRPQPDGSTYLRTTQYLMPFISLTPGGENTGAGVIFIVSPTDDTHHNLIYGLYAPGADFNDGNGMPASLNGTVGTLPYDPHNFGRLTGGRDENWGQDREAMQRGHFSGFTGNLIQEDMVTQLSMGPVVDRTLDHLSSSDAAVIHTRNLLLDALKDVAEGRLPPGAGVDLDFRDVVPENRVLLPGKDRSDPAIDFYKAAS